MNRTPSWSALVPGLIITSVLASIVIAVLFFARVGQLRGSTIDLTVVAPSSGELQEGSEVWFAGQRVGVVDQVLLLPPTTDTVSRVALVTRVLQRVAPLIRADARAEIRRGGTVLGAYVLTIGNGSAEAPPVANGDTLQLYVRPGFEEFRDQLAPAVRSVPALRRDLQALRTTVTADVGTIGAALHGEEIARTRQLVGRLRALTAQVTRGRGAVPGLLGERSELRRRAAQAAAQADSLRQLLASDDGSLGRFRRDSTLQFEIAAVQREVDSIRVALGSASGTAGRALHDGILELQVDSLALQLRLLADDARRRPFRYLTF